MRQQVLLVVAGPRQVAVRAQQHGRRRQLLARVHHVVHPVRPPRDRQPAGLVEQQAAALARQLVEASALQLHVGQPPAEQLVPLADVVADPGPDDLLGQVPVHLLEVHQLRHQAAHRLRARLGGDQQHLRAGVLQDVGGHRAPFGLVAVQQPARCPAADLGGQLPAEVERVLDAEVEPLPADRRVDVRRVAGQQDPADPVALGQPGGVAEAGQPARRVHAEVGAGDGPQLLPELVEGRRGRAVLGHSRGGHADAVRAVPEGHRAEPLLGLADLGHDGVQLLRRNAHLHLAQQRVDPAGLAGELDAEQLAHRAAAAVAADEVPRPQLRAVGQLDGHAVVVLAQPDDLAAAPDLGAELGGALGQQAVGDGLRDAEHVGVRGVELGRGLGDAGEEAADRVLPAVLRNRSSRPRWSITSMLRTCRPSDRTTLVGSASFSSTSTCTPCSRNSLASISPVGPPPATMTSNMCPHSLVIAW